MLFVGTQMNLLGLIVILEEPTMINKAKGPNWLILRTTNQRRGTLNLKIEISARAKRQHAEAWPRRSRPFSIANSYIRKFRWVLFKIIVNIHFRNLSRGFPSISKLHLALPPIGQKFSFALVIYGTHVTTTGKPGSRTFSRRARTTEKTPEKR